MPTLYLELLGAFPAKQASKLQRGTIGNLVGRDSAKPTPISRVCGSSERMTSMIYECSGLLFYTTSNYSLIPPKIRFFSY